MLIPYLSLISIRWTYLGKTLVINFISNHSIWEYWNHFLILIILNLILDVVFRMFLFSISSFYARFRFIKRGVLIKLKKISKHWNNLFIYYDLWIFCYIFITKPFLKKYIKLGLRLINNGIILLCKKAVCYIIAKMSYDVVNIKTISVIFKQQNV